MIWSFELQEVRFGGLLLEVFWWSFVCLVWFGFSAWCFVGVVAGCLLFDLCQEIFPQSHYR